jgi:hypothetical protein
LAISEQLKISSKALIDYVKKVEAKDECEASFALEKRRRQEVSLLFKNVAFNCLQAQPKTRKSPIGHESADVQVREDASKDRPKSRVWSEYLQRSAVET